MPPRPILNRLLVAGTLLLVCSIGCESKPPITSAGVDVDAYEQVDAPESDPFHDHVESNRSDDGTVSGLSFVDTEGDTVSVDQYKGKQNVLLVFTRGFSGMLCPFCTTQTSRLISNYDKFEARDTEILLVYPGAKDQLSDFMRAGMEGAGKDAFPFPVLLDEDLAAVNRLGIAAHLAYPSTYLIDKQGNVRLSYVGSTPADRPSIQALIEQIDAIDRLK